MTTAARTPISRADLLRVLCAGTTRAPRLAAALGYEPKRAAPRQRPGKVQGGSPEIATTPEPAGDVATPDMRMPIWGAAWTPNPDLPAPAPAAGETPPQELPPLTTADWFAAGDAPYPQRPPPIVPRQRLLPALQLLLSDAVPGGIDVGHLTRQLARRDLPARLPVLQRQRIAPRLTLVLDLSGALGQYRYDLHQLARWLDRHPDLRPQRIAVVADAGQPLAGWVDWRAANAPAARDRPAPRQPWWPFAVDDEFLLVSDVGLAAAAPQTGPAWPAWRAWLRRATAAGAGVRLLSPVPLRSPPVDAVCGALPALHWSAAAPMRRRALADGLLHRSPQREKLADAILARLACAPWIDASLLRQVRLTVPGAGDAGLEHLAWTRIGMSEGAIGRRLCEEAQVNHRAAFGRLGDAVQRQMLALMHEHYRRFSPPLAHMHALAAGSRISDTVAQEPAARHALESARAFVRRFARHAESGLGLPPHERSLALSGWVAAADAQEQARQSDVFALLRAAWQRLHPAAHPLPAPAGLSPAYLEADADAPVRQCWLVHDARSGQLWLSPRPAAPGQGLLHAQPLLARAVDLARWGAAHVQPLRLDGQRPLGLGTARGLPMLALRSAAGTFAIGRVQRPRGVVAWSHGPQGLSLRGAPLGPLALQVGADDVDLLPPAAGSGGLRIAVRGRPAAQRGIAFGIDPEFGLWLDLTLGAATQRLRWIEAGEFWMGSPAGEPGRFDDEGPRHRVRISRGFWLADTPCTQGFWRELTGDMPSHFKGDERPVEQVSWNDVQAGMEKLGRLLPSGVRAGLPTEAEWEYSARAGKVTAYNLGATIGNDDANFRDQTCPVKQYKPNGWGLYDCHGQVGEWCQDAMRDYANTVRGDAVLTDPEGPSGPGAKRVVRGGAWFFDPRRARCAYRGAGGPGFRGHVLGFRLALRSTGPAGPEGPSGPGTGADPGARRDAGRQARPRRGQR